MVGLGACPLMADAASGIETLSQGWSAAEQEAFWFGNQGSRLLSYDLFLNLEQADSADLFRAPANIERLGYIPWGASQRNPDGLPIGFVKDVDPDTAAAATGFTCAACHTSTIKVGERTLLIDGGQTLADVTRFLDALVAAMQANQEGEKLDRLVTRMHGAAAEAGRREDLLARLRAETAALEARRDRNRSTTEYGHGRLDAFGQIFNEVAANTPGAGTRSPSAPVSYPFLWGAPHSDVVQWNGVSPNAPPFGSLDRNVTEVLGVFGEFTVPADNPAGRPSSVRVPLLAELENLLEHLWRPSWREAGLPLDETQVSEGERVYRQHCGGCHLVLDDPTAPRRSIDAKMIELTEIGTDPRMAIDALAIDQSTGKPYRARQGRGRRHPAPCRQGHFRGRGDRSMRSDHGGARPGRNAPRAPSPSSGRSSSRWRTSAPACRRPGDRSRRHGRCSNSPAPFVSKAKPP